MPRVRTPWIFTRLAGVYEALTAQEPWRRHCAGMAAYLEGPCGVGDRAPRGDASTGAPRVVDLGIGPGVSGIELVRADPRLRLVGVDCSAAMLRRARRNGAAAGVAMTLVRGDAARLPFADASLDAAIGHSFLYLLADRERVLREIRRVLRPGGRVAFLEPSDVAGRRRWRAVLAAYRIGPRFGTSMLLWGVFSALHGRSGAAALAAALERCGFVEAHVAPAFDGLGMVATARRP